MSVSIVTYPKPVALLEASWRTLIQAGRELVGAGWRHALRVVVVDNSDPPTPSVRAFVEPYGTAPSIVLQVGHGNLGYRVAHNAALVCLDSDHILF